MMATSFGAGQKFEFFVQKSWFFCNCKHYDIIRSVKTLWHHAIHTVFAFFIFSISFKSLFLYFLIGMISIFMFKDSNEFTNFPFKTKYNLFNIVFFVNISLILSREKQEKKIVKTFIWLNPLFIC